MKTQGGSGTARRGLYSIIWAVMLLLSTLTFPQRVEALPYPLVAECTNNVSAGAADISCAITTSAGHQLVALFYGDSGTCNAGVSDSFSLGWIAGTQLCQGGVGTHYVAIFSAKTATNSGSTTVHVHAFTGSIFFIDIWDVGLSVAPAQNDGGQGASGSGGPATISTGNVTTSVAADLLAAIAISQTCSSALGAGTGWRVVTQNKDTAANCMTTAYQARRELMRQLLCRMLPVIGKHCWTPLSLIRSKAPG